MSFLNNKKMIHSKLKTSMLNNMRAGDEITLKVPTARDIETARSICYRMNRLNNEITFSTHVDFKELTINILARKKIVEDE
jgi:hypothetical protein